MSVCKDCKDRTLTCHDTCERFRAESEERAALKRKIKMGRYYERQADDTFYDGIERMKNRRRHGKD